MATTTSIQVSTETRDKLSVLKYTEHYPTMNKLIVALIEAYNFLKKQGYTITEDGEH